MKDKTKGFLGLLRRGGRLYFGETLLYSLGKVKLIILARDAEIGTKKLYFAKTETRNIPLLLLSEKKILGEAIGFSSISAIGIKDAKAAKKIIELEKGEEDEETNPLLEEEQ